MTKIQKIFLISVFYFLSCNSIFAAQIYFEPEPTTYKVGDEFTLSLLLDTESKSVNAVEINILVPKLLKIKSISKNGSMIQLWVNEPSFSGEVISITGGIPGGTTKSKGVIAKITFEATAIGSGNIAFMSNSSVLLNDGQGTKLDLEMTGGPVFSIIPRPKESSTQEPESNKEDEKIKDKKKPERFQIMIGEDPRVFSGKKFISFFTTDKDSGIDRYEVKEGKGSYQIAQSPYLVSDQNIKTVIRVRAYDSENNYRESIYPGLLKRIWWWITRVASSVII
ncbi:MAG: cohesin domain-containing protein [bacterium]|nr:cohesin domain-containing protein [bacterium]